MNEELSEQVGKLPPALQTIFEKLTVLSEKHPEFNLKVEVEGDVSKVDYFYQRFDSKLYPNSKQSRSAIIRQNKTQSNQSSILNRSKTIKKSKDGAKVVVVERDDEEFSEHSAVESL